MAHWCLSLLGKYKKNAESKKSNNIHVFCLDFASALLVNIIHNSVTLEGLESNQRMTL